MRKEGGFGRDKAVGPTREGLSTEDIARTETEDTDRTDRTDRTDKTDETGVTEASREPAKNDVTDVSDADRMAPRTHEPSSSRPESKPESRPESKPTVKQEPDTAPLLEAKQAEDLRLQWQEIQQGFVDDPQSSVRAADGLVAEAMQLLATTFADHKHGLEGQWHRGEEVATEDLRLALQQYRSFFDRLLSA
jgi:hypothetical protein